jgi:hypothetical protein
MIIKCLFNRQLLVCGGVLLKDKRLSWLKTLYSLSINKSAYPLNEKSKTPAINGILNDRHNPLPKANQQIHQNS